MKIHFQRQALYDQVWSTPLSKLGPQYGISDNGLRKICKAMNIPVPERGYWAKRDAGQPVEQVSLAAESDTETYTAYVADIRSPEHQRGEDEEWLARRIADEEVPGKAVPYTLAPTRWHSLLVPLRKRLIESVKAREKWEAEKRREEEAAARNRRPRLRVPNFDHLVFRGDGLLVPRHGASCLRVSAVTYERALAIVNALLLAAEKRGCEVGLDEERGRFEIRMEDATLYFAVRERQEHKVGSSGYREYLSTNKLALALELRGRYSPSEILDRQDQAVEERLSEVFPRLYRAVVTAREDARALAAQKARSAAHWAEQEILEVKRKVMAEAMAVAEARKAALIEEAAKWRGAERLRAYVAAVAARSGGEPISEESLIEWQVWALSIADEIDPICRRIRSISNE